MVIAKGFPTSRSPRAPGNCAVPQGMDAIEYIWTRGLSVRYSHYFRRPLALVLCGLVGVVSGLPRVGCICPSGDECVDCADHMPVAALFEAAGLRTSSDCCCCAQTDASSHGAGV